MGLSTFLVTCANPRCGQQNPLRHPSFQNDAKRLIGVVFKCIHCDEVNEVSADHDAEEIPAQPLAAVLPFPKLKGAEESAKPTPAVMPKRRPEAKPKAPQKQQKQSKRQPYLGLTQRIDLGLYVEARQRAEQGMDPNEED